MSVEARDFAKASAGFIQLRENPDVQEPTRSWAAIEAVVATYLDGKSSDARSEAKKSAAHVESVPENSRIGGGLIEMLARVQRLPGIPPKEGESSAKDASSVMAWMLAGLKNWEQGMTEEAASWFSAVAGAKISPDDSWLTIYQALARDYLGDQRVLAGPVFANLPKDIASCENAVAELDQLLGTLKTRGRARFNVRAWQLDLAKHQKLLADPPKPETSETGDAESNAWDLVAIMAKLDELAKECRFSEASELVQGLTADPEGATRASLVAVTDSSAAFLTDLEKDLGREPVSGDFVMKSGEVVKKIAIGPQAAITVTDVSNNTRTARWADFSPDALIALHRKVVLNLTNESERLRRHECAISYDWLAGNRERALTAATLLSQSSPDFKQRWDAIASGLPK